MESYDYESEHRKKRRRRDIPPAQIDARLVFDEDVKGNAAILSADLWALFDRTTQAYDRLANGKTSAFVGVTPASPLHTTLQDSMWTIMPVEIQSRDTTVSTNQPHVIRLSPRASANPSFLKTFLATDHNRHGGHVPKSIDVRVVPASPIILETIYISVEKGLLEKVDELQAKFGGGFSRYGKNAKAEKRLQEQQKSAQNASNKTEDRITTVIREGLSQLAIIHSGDTFQLPLPSHPITHARPPPAIVIDCEPLAQGVLNSKTKIVLVETGSQQNSIKKLLPAQPIIEESLEDTAEDTSNDQFYSATEDRHTTTASEMDGGSDEDSGEDDSDEDQSDDGSDSMDDLISLTAPGLPPQQAGTLSAMTAATPRPGNRMPTGTHTPGSIYSSFSATTARAGSLPGKVFRTEALLRKVPVDILHPKPQLDDDEESFVFVDTSTLAKIGCFSGDWVRIEPAKNVSAQGALINGLVSVNGFTRDEDSEWRTVRIFGLTGLANQKPRYAVDKTGDRKSSFSQRESYTSLTPVIYLSPVLIANLSNAQFIKVGALPKADRQNQRHIPLQRLNLMKSPPVAKEVRLLKLSTPMTTSRELQAVLFSGLKRHFERQRRVLKKGDLIAIPVDVDLGKLLSTPETNESSPTPEDLLNKLQLLDAHKHRDFHTAWFYVDHIDADFGTELVDESQQNAWGGVAIVDSANTRTSRDGDFLQSISWSIELWTKYWLGISKVPQQNPLSSEIVTSTASLPQLEKLPIEKRVSELVTAAISPRALSLAMPPIAILLHSSQRQIGKSFTALSACSDVGVHAFLISAYALLSENASSSGGGDVKTEATLRARAERALSSGAQHTAVVIQHIDALTADRIVQTLQDIIANSRVFIATTSKIDDIPDGVRSLFTHELEMRAPNETDRETILRNGCTSTTLPLASNVNLKNIALQTAALVAGDLLDIVDRASLARTSRLQALARDQSCTIADIVISGGVSSTHLLATDFVAAVSAARSTFSDAIGAPKIPKVTWNDVGGLSSQKDAIMETISLPLTHPELFANGVRKRSGILFYGPPGTGKTLLAKAIATEFSLNFFSVKGPELLNMYIGESEANVRRVFQRARDARPCVVFFDELDSVAPKRGNQGDSGGVMDRIVSQLLAELDGMSSSGGSDPGQGSASSSSSGGGVFVIGATNRPDLLDPALLRPGRFDKMLYLGVADTHEQQVTILQALTHKFTLAPDVNLTRVASHLPYTYTGADLYALCSDAMLKAITRKTQAVDNKVREISKQRGEEISTGYFFDHLATDEDLQVVVNEDDFALAQQELVGSVSQKELEHFERIRCLFEEQDIGSGTSQYKKQNTHDQRSNGTATTLSRPGVVQNTGVTPSQVPPQVDHGQRNDRAHGPFPAALPILGKSETNGKKNQNTLAPPVTKAQNKSLSRRIANPDSGASDSELDGAVESDFGISSRHLNGNISNGVNAVEGLMPLAPEAVNSDYELNMGMGRGKGKAKAEINHDTSDNFVHDDAGNDDGLYD